MRRTREYVDVVRQVTGGEVVDYDGDLFSLSGFRLRNDPPDVAPPVDVAGIGPNAVELAGRFADGWHAIFLTPDGVRERLDDLERGASLGDTDLDDFQSLVKIPCCALDDGEEARRLARRHIGFYVGAMGTFYRDALVRQGFDVAEDVHGLWQSGDRAEAIDAIDDELLDTVAAAWTPDQARELVEEFAAIDGVDVVAITFPREADQDVVLDTIRAVAPQS